MTNPKQTHWWLYCLELENPIRDSYCRIEYRWYAENVTRFEAVFVSGESFKNKKYILKYNEKNIFEFSSKDEILKEINKYIEASPKECKDLFLQHFHLFEKTLNG